MSIDAEQPKLLPCPFCGADAICDKRPVFGTDRFITHCSKCYASDTYQVTEAEAVTSWNRRAPHPYRSVPVATEDPIALIGAWKQITDERQRQISEEGWTPEHDDQHSDGSMLRAAVIYLWHGTDKGTPIDEGVPPSWPWDAKWWKPRSRVRNVIRAGALCLADRDRRVRAGLPTGPADHKLGLALCELAALASASTPDPGSRAVAEEPRVGIIAHVAPDKSNLTHVVAALSSPPARSEERVEALDALRADGWTVAVHNDYRQGGMPFTFWLLTHPDGRYIKGEGRTDADALARCAEKARSLTAKQER